MTTPIDVAELRALLDKATPGPWRAELYNGAGGQCLSLEVPSSNGAWTGLIPGFMRDWNDWPDGKSRDRCADLDLIVAAVNSLPALLTELERLREVERAKDDAVRLLRIFRDGNPRSEDCWAADRLLAPAAAPGKCGTCGGTGAVPVPYIDANTGEDGGVEPQPCPTCAPGKGER